MRGVHATLDDIATAIVVVRIVVGVVVVIAIRVEAAEGVAEPAIVVAKATIMVAAAEAAIMIMESLREAAMETTAAAKTSTKAAGVTASESAATEAAAMATAKAAASAKAAAAKTAAVAATTTAAAATRQCHGRRGEADSRNCHQRDHCFTQHHHSPSERLHPAACAWTHEMAIASGKHHHFGGCLRSTLCDLVELVAHLRNADIGRDHDIARNPLHRLAPSRYIAIMPRHIVAGSLAFRP